ncbi:MAG: transglycosylase SLT domain-containing protein [Bacteriovorax sp.]|jgi:hypothetical protein
MFNSKSKTTRFLQFAVAILSLAFIQSCSSLNSPEIKAKNSKNHKNEKSAKIENFDKESIPNESFVIANMISVVQPELIESDRNKIAVQISNALKKFKVEPQIMVAIIDTESDFKADKVSSTGDLSLAQINVDVWNKEFKRMKLKTMRKEKIIIDQQYALMKMAEILSIIKKRHAKKDRRWYARYHSNTHNHKKDYLQKLEIRMRMLALSTSLNQKIAQYNQSKASTL